MARRMVVAAAAAVIGLVLTGCAAGLDAQTMRVLPSVPGVNIDAPDGSVLVRNAVVAFPGPQGYGVGQAAAVEMMLFNQTDAPVRLIGADSAAAGSVTIGGPAPTPATPPAGVTGLVIPPTGYAPATLTANQLAITVDGVTSLPLALSFDNNVVLSFDVPMTTPLEPVPQEPTPQEPTPYS